MTIHRFSNGDELVLENKALIVRFTGKRRVLSTAPHNGGYRENLRWVFNQDCKIDGDKSHVMKAPTYAGHMRILCDEMGLEPEYACGVITAADMENVSIKSAAYSDTTVTAVVTAGIDENGGRVGDPSSWYEPEEISQPGPGTINIMLFIDATLPEGTMARALVTCTEAKTAALQELMAPSLYSSGIATGSGTDSTIIVSNPESKVHLTWAGKHSKLGELIGRTVMAAVKEALNLQTGLNAERQFDVFARTGRYGISKKTILNMLPYQKKSDIDRASERLDRLSKQRELVVFTCLYVHLLDQLDWGLICPEDAMSGAGTLLTDMGMAGISHAPDANAKSAGEEMLTALKSGLLTLLEDI